MQQRLKKILIVACVAIGLVCAYIFYQHDRDICDVQDDCAQHRDVSDDQSGDEDDVADDTVDLVPPMAGAVDDADIDEDESESDEDADFLVVNRSAEYLRESAIAFYKQHNLHNAVTTLTAAWEPYNDWQLRQLEQKKAPPKKKRHKKSSSRSKQSYHAIITKTPPGKARFSWPIHPTYFWLSSRYGPRRRKDGSPGFHHGVDMAAIKGTRVKAASQGRVVEARYTAGWGNTILIDHLDGRYKTRYAHLDKIRVYNGQQVTKDTWIGDVGATGRVRKKGKDASHLHFELYDRGKRIDPLPYLG